MMTERYSVRGYVVVGCSVVTVTSVRVQYSGRVLAIYWFRGDGVVKVERVQRRVSQGGALWRVRAMRAAALRSCAW